jgi:hypothetical protein
MNFIKVILIASGLLSLCIGIIGLVVPGLPITPFILLTAGSYIKSSDELCAISTMWFTIAKSCIFFITPYSIKLIVPVIGLIGTIVMSLIVPTVYNSNCSIQ